MILTCQGCGGLYGTNWKDRIAGTPCRCVLPKEKATERPEVNSSELLEALRAALGHWKTNADQLRKDGKTFDQRGDYEAVVFRRCKAALSRASNDELSHRAGNQP